MSTTGIMPGRWLHGGRLSIFFMLYFPDILVSQCTMPCKPLLILVCCFHGLHPPKVSMRSMCGTGLLSHMSNVHWHLYQVSQSCVVLAA